MTLVKEKIIIDTDIGDDIDDALAITLALNSPELDILGITTVFGNTRLRARIAARLLEKAGRTDIPVIAGIGKPLNSSINLDEIPCQYSEEMYNAKITHESSAVDFIIEKVMKSDSDITLITIGALTNIAVAILKEPGIKRKLKRIVMMGGSYFHHVNEWNIVCDAEAAKIVFESGIDILCAGLDVTMKCYILEKEIETIRNHGTDLSDFLYKLIRLWNGKVIYLHDPLTVAVAFDQSLVKTERHIIQVETRGEYTRGTTFNLSSMNYARYDKNLKPNASVCREVDSDRFVNLFMTRILTPPSLPALAEVEKFA